MKKNIKFIVLAAILFLYEIYHAQKKIMSLPVIFLRIHCRLLSKPMMGSIKSAIRSL